MNKNGLARGYWECLPKSKQSMVAILGLLKFNNMLIIDEKGDELNKLPHIYSEFNHANGLFERIIHVVNNNTHELVVEGEQLKRIKLFPDIVQPLGSGHYHESKSVTIDKSSFEALKKYETINAFFDVDDRYSFLKQFDKIKLVYEGKADEPILVKITCKYTSTIETYRKENESNFYFDQLMIKQLGNDLKSDQLINVYEFMRTYINE